MTTIGSSIAAMPPVAWACAAAILLCAAVFFGRWTAPKEVTRRAARKKPKGPFKERARHPVGYAGIGAVIVAGLGLSVDTSARFAEMKLNMHAPWSVAGSLILEAMVVGTSLFAWGFSDRGATRTAYLLVVAQGVAAIEVVRAENEDIGVALVRIVGPALLLYGLHKLLKLEAELNRVEIRPDGLLSRMWADRKNRIESRMGIGSRGADAEQITRANAQDKLIRLATLGRPRLMSKKKYETALMRAGDGAFKGLDTFEQLATEVAITTRIDRQGAFKNLPNRNEPYELQSAGPRSAPEGAPVDGPGRAPDDISSLTSEGTPGRTPERAPGHTQGAPEAHPGGARSQSGRDQGDVVTLRRGFDLYCEIRDNTRKDPSQNEFVKAWRDRGYGMSTDDIRDLYRDIHPKLRRDQ